MIISNVVSYSGIMTRESTKKIMNNCILLRLFNIIYSVPGDKFSNKKRTFYKDYSVLITIV